MTFREALSFVLDKACLWDEGPPGEGWPSEKMYEAERVLNEWLDQSNDDQPKKVGPK